MIFFRIGSRMKEGKIRGKILLYLWESGYPMTLQTLSEKIGLKNSSTMGYLLGLIKAKYVSIPQTHYYSITNAGKQAIGLPRTEKILAQKILNQIALENAFYFYTDIDQSTGIYSNSLLDFYEKMKSIDIKSVEFHYSRSDFRKWLSHLGDIELIKKIELLQNQKISGENLRKKLLEIIQSRIKELTNFIC